MPLRPRSCCVLWAEHCPIAWLLRTEGTSPLKGATSACCHLRTRRRLHLLIPWPSRLAQTLPSGLLHTLAVLRLPVLLPSRRCLLLTISAQHPSQARLLVGIGLSPPHVAKRAVHLRDNLLVIMYGGPPTVYCLRSTGLTVRELVPARARARTCKSSESARARLLGKKSTNPTEFCMHY